MVWFQVRFQWWYYWQQPHRGWAGRSVVARRLVCQKLERGVGGERWLWVLLIWTLPPSLPPCSCICPPCSRFLQNTLFILTSQWSEIRGMKKFGFLISETFGFVISQPRLNLSQASLWAQHWDKAWQLGIGSKEAASKYFSIVVVFLYYCINISLLFIIVILYFCISISLLEWRDLLKIWGRRLSAFVEEWG